MSRLTKKAIIIPNGVEVKTSGEEVQVKGPKGQLSIKLLNGISLQLDNNEIKVEKDENILPNKNGFQGLYWALVKNMVIGVSEGFEKRLELVGVGFRAAVTGTKLDIQVGFSHPTSFEIPKDLQVKVEKATEIVVSGADKQVVGQFAAEVRALRPPEPYKGKGIRYKGEYVRKKAGKTAKK